MFNVDNSLFMLSTNFTSKIEGNT